MDLNGNHMFAKSAYIYKILLHTPVVALSVANEGEDAEKRGVIFSSLLSRGLMAAPHLSFMLP